MRKSQPHHQVALLERRAHRLVEERQRHETDQDEHADDGERRAGLGHDAGGRTLVALVKPTRHGRLAALARGAAQEQHRRAPA